MFVPWLRDFHGVGIAWYSSRHGAAEVKWGTEPVAGALDVVWTSSLPPPFDSGIDHLFEERRPTSLNRLLPAITQRFGCLCFAPAPHLGLALQSFVGIVESRHPRRGRFRNPWVPVMGSEGTVGSTRTA
ncbi:hypothetical protein E3T55_18765 [Cryobacterium frigoriphilum]|uniref:Uncharacterized protein n=2 Tax=Cryobacterium frigoriphilum TaxID=1259150 RepID=A0A4R8ZTX8_9MICO|nr:hypothetical protein E3T55_18765 [Cryobacterium frigoriphilum]